MQHSSRSSSWFASPARASPCERPACRTPRITRTYITQHAEESPCHVRIGRREFPAKTRKFPAVREFREAEIEGCVRWRHSRVGGRGLEACEGPGCAPGLCYLWAKTTCFTCTIRCPESNGSTRGCSIPRRGRERGG